MACCSLKAAENCALRLTTLAELAPWCIQMDSASFRYTSTSRSTTFSQLEDADSRGGMGTILVSSLKDGLMSANASPSIKYSDLSPTGRQNGNRGRFRLRHLGFRIRLRQRNSPSTCSGKALPRSRSLSRSRKHRQGVHRLRQTASVTFLMRLGPSVGMS